MRVFGGRDFDISVLVNHADTGIVTKENFGRGNRPHTLTNPDIRAHREELHKSLDARVRSGWAVDVDRLDSIVVIFGGEQPAETASVVAMWMGDEDVVDVADGDAGTRQPTGHAFTGINYIECAVDNQNVRRLRPPHHRDRTASCP